jgi:anti-sigma factor RsiW
MNVMCSAVHFAIDTVGTSAVTGPLAAHTERCEACERELAEFSAVEESLGSLGLESHTAPEDLRETVMDSLGPVAVPDFEHRTSLAVPVAAAAFVATAAAGTAVLIRLRRQSAA